MPLSGRSSFAIHRLPEVTTSFTSGRVWATIARGDYAEGRFIVLVPELNRPVQSACRRYAEQLTEPGEGKAGFGVVTLEAFIAAMRKVGDEAYADALFDRYVDWSQIDEAIEESFSASLAG